MSEPERERRGRELQREIASILMSDWDPLGVRDVAEARDPYDAWVGPVYRLLASGASAEQIARYLVRVETKLGLPAVEYFERLPVAERLGLLEVGSMGEAG